MKKRIKMLTAALCAVVLLCGFSVTAYAGGGPEWEGLDPAEETTTPEPSIEPGEGFTEEGNLVTRDLLYDEHTNKQFITVQTSGGNTFYIIIDYDKPVDEDGEQYQTYFLSVVDETDLLAAAEAAGIELPACECTDKCMAGAVNTDCPVCATNMTECVGVAPEVEPTTDPEPVDDTEPEQPKLESNSTGTIILIVAVALIGGVGAWYFKIYRPKKQAAQPEEEYEEPDYSAYADEDDAPWDEEDDV